MPKFNAEIDAKNYVGKSAMDLALAVQRIILSKGGRCNARNYYIDTAKETTIYGVAVRSLQWINIQNIYLLKPSEEDVGNISQVNNDLPSI